MSEKTKERISPFLERACLFVIKSSIYLSLFTPLVISQRSFFPFVTPKTIYFRILIEIAFAFYLILAILIPRYRPKINGVFVSILVFIFILILSSFLGINFQRSFWSVYERMTGIFTFLHLLAFFVVLTSVFKDKDDWRKFLAVSILAGVFLCIGLISTNQISSRGGGTIGNTSFMAAYLLFDVFFALFLFLEKKNMGWRIFSGISLLFLIPVLLSSTARGAIMSFGLGLFLLFLGYLMFSSQKKLQRAGYFLIFFLIALVLILLVLQPLFVKDKIKQILKDMKPRFVVWETAWKGFLEKPIFGWGPENFNVVFTKFFNSCMFLSECGGEIWFDRAHNIVLDTLVATGVVGFLSYLLIFAVSIFKLLKICFKREGSMFAPLTMMVLLIIYFFHDMLVFDMISSYTVFFLTLGFISFLIEEDKDSFLDVAPTPSDSFLNNKRIQQVIAGSIIISFLFLGYFGNIQPYSSAVSVVNMIVIAETLEESSDHFKKALDSSMEKYEVREQFAQEVYQASLKSGFPNNIGLFFNLAEEEMQKSVEKNPLDFRPRLFLGRTYFAHYRTGHDKNILDLAEKTLKEAIILSPTNQQAYWHLAEIAMFKNDFQSSYVLFQQAIDLEPRLGKSHWFLAMVYKITGEYDLALVKLEDAENNGYNWKNNMFDLMNASEVYLALQGDQGLILIYEDALKHQPQSAELWANLAASYANIGRLDKAREAALRVLDIDPNLLPRVQEFLGDLNLE